MASISPPGRTRPSRQAGQPVQRRHRAGGHHVRAHLPGQFLRGGLADLGVAQLQLLARTRPGRSPGAPSAPAGSPGRPAAAGPARCRAAPLRTRGPPACDGRGHQIGDRGAVQQVPGPQPGHLAGPEQSPGHPGPGQQPRRSARRAAAPARTPPPPPPGEAARSGGIRRHRIGAAAAPAAVARGPGSGPVVMRGSAHREDDHPAVRLLALGLTAQPGGRDRVVHDLALERGHRVEPLGHARWT